MRRRFYTCVGSFILVACIFTACNQGNSGGPDLEERTAAAQKYQFTEVSMQAGLSGFKHETGTAGDQWFPESMGSGGGFFDYNNDGWQDIILAGGGAWDDRPVQSLYLYRNNQDGSFTDVSTEAGLQDVDAYSIGFSAADYDNDGDTDLFVTTLGENLLYRNEGAVSGTYRFTEVGKQSGLSDEATWSSAAMFFDADKDGFVDLYVGNYVDWSPDNDLVCYLEGQIRSYCKPELYNGVPSRFIGIGAMARLKTIQRTPAFYQLLEKPWAFQNTTSIEIAGLICLLPAIPSVTFCMSIMAMAPLLKREP